jgi:hypothetical protein
MIWEVRNKVCGLFYPFGKLRGWFWGIKDFYVKFSLNIREYHPHVFCGDHLMGDELDPRAN